MKQPNFLKILKLVTTPSLWDVDNNKIICESEDIYFFSSSNGVTFRTLSGVRMHNVVYDTSFILWWLLLPFILFLKVYLVFRKSD